MTFTVTNEGTIPHEFVVLKTDTSAADIPLGKFEGEPDRINEDTAARTSVRRATCNPAPRRR